MPERASFVFYTMTQEGDSPGRFFQAAQESRRKTLKEVKIQGVQEDGKLLISPVFSRSAARIASLQDLLGGTSGGGRPAKITLSFEVSGSSK